MTLDDAVNETVLNVTGVNTVAPAALRRRVLTSVRVSARGHVACFDPKVTA